ncbi:Frataxin [Thozetella sp. PMI_491]|nr:Frataxin [Thozetella sp. PMI_491]
MAAAHLVRATRLGSLRAPALVARPLPLRCAACAFERHAAYQSVISRSLLQPKSLSTSAARRVIVPDGQPRAEVESPKEVQTAADITEETYHQVADLYLDRLLGQLEEMQDKRDDVEVEYASGVLTLNLGHDTYVINKQPPNKQIWLSSPKTGPKRYDYVIRGDGQGDKQDTAIGEWVYLRDNSTLDQLLVDEIGVDIRHHDS